MIKSETINYTLIFFSEAALMFHKDIFQYVYPDVLRSLP